MFEVLTDRAILQLSGPDSVRFLQNFTTNDIEKDQFSYNFLLNSQGRYLFDFFVYNQDNINLYIDCSKQHVLNLIKKLSIYKLRSNIEIKDVSDIYYSIYALTDKLNISNIIYNLPDPRNNLFGFRVLAERSDPIVAEESIEGLYEGNKYKHCIIDGSKDLEYEKSIPIEYGAEELNAINYHKGCYVGQEVISRAKYQGVVRKKIYQLKFSTPPKKDLSNCEIINKNGERIGKICSNNEIFGIAQIKEEQYLALGDTKNAFINGEMVEILLPPWKNDTGFAKSV